MSTSTDLPAGQTTDQSATTVTTQAAPVTTQQAAPAETPVIQESVAAPYAQVALDPLWLPKRLEQEKRAAYRALGVKDAEEAKALIAKAKQSDDSSKAKQQQDADLAKQVEKATADLERYRKATQAQADRALSTLTQQQQAYVMKRAGDDPAKLLDEIEDLRTLLSFNAPAAPAAPAVQQAATAPEVQAPSAQAAPSAPAPKAPIPAPATTSSPAAAPKQSVQQPTDHYATWQRLRAVSPLQADAYYDKNERAINAQIEARRKQP